MYWFFIWIWKTLLLYRYLDEIWFQFLIWINWVICVHLETMCLGCLLIQILLCIFFGDRYCEKSYKYPYYWQTLWYIIFIQLTWLIIKGEKPIVLVNMLGKIDLLCNMFMILCIRWVLLKVLCEQNSWIFINNFICFLKIHEVL